MFRKLAVALVLVAAVASLAAASASASPTPKTALVYGDSLTFESRYAIANRIALRSGWTVATHAFGGTAVCDWIPWLATDLVTYHPSIVAVETVGNASRPCMLDADGNVLVQGSAAFYAKYQADMNTFAAAVTATGAKLVFIAGPPMLNATWNAAVLGLLGVERKVAASYPGVSVSISPRNAVSAAGVYQATKPCLASETAAMGCINGQIAIRTNVGLQTGIHFCPTGLDAGYPYACGEYSSGEFPFGGAMANTVVAPPPPIRPTVTMVRVSGVEGSALAFRPSLLLPYSQDLALCYTTADGTATVAAGDYTASSGCFVIPAWTTSGPTITVSTLLDHISEPSESFKLKVSGWVVPITGNTKTVSGIIKANVT
jgi:hypothetical protein